MFGLDTVIGVNRFRLGVWLVFVCLCYLLDSFAFIWGLLPRLVFVVWLFGVCGFCLVGGLFSLWAYCLY